MEVVVLEAAWAEAGVESTTNATSTMTSVAAAVASITLFVLAVIVVLSCVMGLPEYLEDFQDCSLIDAQSLMSVHTIPGKSPGAPHDVALFLQHASGKSTGSGQDQVASDAYRGRKSNGTLFGCVRRRSLIAVGVFIIAFAAFFFLVPVVPMVVFPCFSSGNGYASLSYYIFSNGEVVSAFGHFSWLTQRYSAHCF